VSVGYFSNCYSKTGECKVIILNGTCHTKDNNKTAEYIFTVNKACSNFSQKILQFPSVATISTHTLSVGPLLNATGFEGHAKTVS
jgi:hypothetical protein